MKRVAGVDPSLSSTGLAIITQTDGYARIPGRVFLTTMTVKVPATGTGPVAEVERVAEIVATVTRSTGTADPMYVEGLAMSSRTGKYAERAHLFFSLVAALHARRKCVEVVAPTSLKKRVTGSGRADKEAVLTAVREAWSDRGWDDGLAGGRYDRADAAALAWLAAVELGWDVPPLSANPVTRAA